MRWIHIEVRESGRLVRRGYGRKQCQGLARGEGNIGVPERQYEVYETRREERDSKEN